MAGKHQTTYGHTHEIHRHCCQHMHTAETCTRTHQHKHKHTTTQAHADTRKHQQTNTPAHAHASTRTCKHTHMQARHTRAPALSCQSGRWGPGSPAPWEPAATCARPQTKPWVAPRTRGAARASPPPPTGGCWTPPPGEGAGPGNWVSPEAVGRAGRRTRTQHTPCATLSVHRTTACSHRTHAENTHRTETTHESTQIQASYVAVHARGGVKSLDSSSPVGLKKGAGREAE